MSVTPDEIVSAERAIRSHIRTTPILELRGSELGCGDCRVTLKLEQLQHSGSFKARGAFCNLLTREVPTVGVTAASGGNHGAAVAYAAMTLGIPATIFVPKISSPAKIARIQHCGARLMIEGDRYADALAASENWCKSTGSLPIHAFDQRETLLGQGTLGLEFEQQAPDLTAVLMAVGGGGLIGGVAAWYGNRTEVIGVEPSASPTLTRAFEAGGPVDAETGGLAADSLAPRRVGALVYPVLRRYCRRVLLVSDDEIRRAQATLWDIARIVAEPGGAAAFAALLAGHFRPPAGSRIGVVISGGNTVAVDFDRAGISAAVQCQPASRLQL